jgi:hypothetical protein
MQLLDSFTPPGQQHHEIRDAATALVSADQARIAALIERYRNGPREFGRAALLEQIAARLMLHLAIGDQLLCPLVRRLRPAIAGLDEIEISHYVIHQLLRRLQQDEVTVRQRDALMTALADYLEHYFIEELELLLMPLQGGPLDPDTLGARIAGEKRRLAPWLGLLESDV